MDDDVEDTRARHAGNCTRPVQAAARNCQRRERGPGAARGRRPGPAGRGGGRALADPGPGQGGSGRLAHQALRPAGRADRSGQPGGAPPPGRGQPAVHQDRLGARRAPGHDQPDNPALRPAAAVGTVLRSAAALRPGRDHGRGPGGLTRGSGRHGGARRSCPGASQPPRHRSSHGDGARAVSARGRGREPGRRQPGLLGPQPGAREHAMVRGRWPRCRAAAAVPARRRCAGAE